MRAIKKPLTILALVMTAICLSNVIFVGAATVDESGYNGFVYETSKNGTIGITGYNGNEETVNIPSSIDGKAVTSIRAFAFDNCKSMQTVIIPNSITSIENYAFTGCTALNDVTIPQSVSALGTGVFSYCSNLERVIVEEGNPGYVSENGVLFDKSKSTILCCPCRKSGSYIIPVTVKTLEKDAFSGCVGINKIIMPDGIENIADGAFYGCNGIDSILIPDSVTNVGPFAFGGCVNLKFVKLSAGISKLSFGVFEGCTALNVISIPNAVEAIEGYAFYKCSNLRKVIVFCENAVIDDSAFWGCSSLTIYGVSGSYAETYANQHHIPFVKSCPSCNTLLANETVEIVPAVAATYTQTGATQGLRCTHCGAWIIEPEALETKPIDFTMGDISGNGVLTVDDATMLQRFLAEFIELDLEDEKTFLQADMNGDGYVSVKDVTAVQRKVAELI